MSFFDNLSSEAASFFNDATNIVRESALDAIGREVDEEFEDETPAPQDDRTFITTGSDAPINAAGENSFSLAKITDPNNMVMVGGALIAAVVLIKLVK